MMGDRTPLYVAGGIAAFSSLGFYLLARPQGAILSEEDGQNHFRHLPSTVDTGSPSKGWVAPHRVRLSKKKLTDAGDVDVVLVGSGLGSLTVASLLSQRGYKVMVLEQHDQAGGCLHTFEEKGYEFDVGLHYVGGQVGNKWSPLRKMFDAVTGGRVEWCKMSDPYDSGVCTGESKTDAAETFDWCSDYNATADKLIERFPDEKRAIRKFFSSAHGASMGLGGWVLCKMMPPFLRKIFGRLLMSSYVLNTTTSEHLKNIGVKSTKLAGVLTYLFGDYGLHPDQSCWGVHAIVFDHWRGGAFYPYGGSSSLAMGACEVIRKRGGHVFVNARVDEILVENGRAVGVKLAKDGLVVKAGIVVSDIGVRNTMLGLVQEKDRTLLNQPFLKSLQEGGDATREGKDCIPGGLAPSCTLLNLFVGLSASTEELGIPAANAWVVPGWDHTKNLDAFMKDPKSNPCPVVFIGSNSAKDESYESRFGKKRGSIMVLAPVSYAWFKEWEAKRVHSRGGEYDQLKEFWTEKLLTALYNLYPAVKGKIAFTDLGTPLSNNFFLGVKHGEVYGLTHSVERMTSTELSCETNINNLYVTGQDVMTAGVSAALLAGYLTTAAISKTAILSHIHNII